MRNERGAGRKTKFKEGTQTKILHKLIPVDSENEVKQSIENIIQKWTRQK
jgi:hypothetical protein